MIAARLFPFFGLAAGVISLAAGPARSLDLRSTATSGQVVPTLTNGELAINRADRTLFFRNADGTIGRGALMDAVAAGRDAVEKGEASALMVKPTGSPSASTLSDAIASRVPAADAQSTAAPGKLPRFYNIGNTGIPALDVTGQGMIVSHSRATGGDVHTFRVDRIATYSGGAFGFVNAAIKAYVKTAPGQISFENAGLFQLDNYANTTGVVNTTPQNSGLAVQSNKHGTAPTWAAVMETIDRTGLSDPVAGQTGIELDITGNGTDANYNRQGLGIVAGRPGNASGAFTGGAVTVGYGIVLARQVIDAAANRFRTGLSFGTPSAATDFDKGIDFGGATFSTGGPAINLAAGQRVAWDAPALHHTRYEANHWRFTSSGAEVVRIHDNGSAAFGPISPLVVSGYGAISVGNPTNGGIVQITDGVIDARIQASAANAMSLGTSSAHDLIFKRNDAEVGRFTANGRLSTPYHTPPSSTAACLVGEAAWDGSYEYRCVAANTWKRAPLTTW